MKASKILMASAVAACAAAQAGVMDRPQGINIGEHMTLRPYVGLSYTYDSNIDSSKHSKGGSTWVVNPGVSLDYLNENWCVSGEAYYQYHAYQDYGNQLNESSYGETLSLKWTNSEASEKGWSLLLSETFRQISQDDDMTSSDGRGIGRDRMEFSGNGALERRINAYWRAAVMGNYYYLDYENNTDKYAPLYGWSRAVLGGEIAFAPSPWTDIILHGNYQWYTQENDEDRYDGGNDMGVARDSKGLSVMAGLGTRATERIKYRILGGWSRFEYGDGIKTCNGFTYQFSVDYRLSDTITLMALGSSYYQPSETDYATAVKVNTVSLGLGKVIIPGKLSATADLAYRNESREFTVAESGDYDNDVITARVGLNYTVNRFMSFYGSVEYQTQETSGGNTGGHYYDYDRVRGTVGVRLTY